MAKITAEQVASDLASESAASAQAQTAIFARIAELEEQVASLKQVVASALGINV